MHLVHPKVVWPKRFRAPSHTMHVPLKDLMLEIRSLEPFPGVAARVLEVAGREDVVPSELIELVQTDPGITSKVLKLCNSAYYGFQREIASLHEAGNLLGVTTLVNLVLTSSAGKYFRDYGSARGQSMDARWQQCVSNAIGARLIASEHQLVDPDRAYTAGLLENIGHLVLDRFLEEALAEIRTKALSGADLMDAEREVLGLHHAEIGARLSTRWSLPSVLVEVIRHHHEPELAGKDAALAATVHLAEILTQELAVKAGDEPLRYSLNDKALDLTGLTRTQLAGFAEELRAEMVRARDFVSG
ncbi:MAG: HDOD domain-containing protein [Planctomycetota bacterium]|nr:HDOD domain-containing protein [Planctomycetota bacterium]